MLRYTYSTPDVDEIHAIIRDMRSSATPGPDGLNAAFYKSAWHWAKDDIYKVVKDFYTHARIPADLNQTFIALIPKKNNPIIPQDYRPIGLCNVIYKIIAKSLANRISPIMLAKLNLLSLLIGIFLLISSSLKRSSILLTLKIGILTFLCSKLI